MASRSATGTAYNLSGPATAPVVVLIHGLGLNRHVWQWHEPALASRFRIVNYDLYGHGESVAPPTKPSLTVYAEQLRGLLDALGIRQAALVGFSLGGMINRRFALDYPSRVSALAILNSPHERSPEQQRLVEERATQSAAGGPGATLDATIERWFTAEFRSRRPEVIVLVRQWVLANDALNYAQCREVLAKGVIELIRPATPVAKLALVMTCENDTGSSVAMTHAIAGEIAGAQTIIVPQLQHMGLVEQPELFTEPLIHFLAASLGGQAP